MAVADDIKRFAHDLAERTGVPGDDVIKILTELGIEKTASNFDKVFGASQFEALSTDNLSVSISFAKTMIHK